jgi:hypothetical protein
VGIHGDFKGPSNELTVGFVQKRPTGFEETTVSLRNFLDFLFRGEVPAVLVQGWFLHLVKIHDGPFDGYI